MLDSKKAESFVGIVVGVFILAFVMLGIVSILIFSTDISTKYNENNRIQVLKQNVTNIVKSLDTSMLEENEVFYIHKNRASLPENNVYEIYTGSTNASYQYIDELGNTITDIDTFEGDIYSQVLWVTSEDTSYTEGNQVIQVRIKKLVRR